MGRNEDRARPCLVMEVFPGQDLRPCIEETVGEHSENVIKIQVGSGIIQNNDEIIALNHGIFQKGKINNKFNFAFSIKRYIPMQNDLVIGIVTAKLSEFFRVDIGAQTTAVLSILNGFEASTKKNKPNWNIGTLIFARVSLAHPDLEPELSCFDPSGRIPLDVFGEIGGNSTIQSTDSSKTQKDSRFSMLLRTSCNYSKKLQNPSKCPVIGILGTYFEFEIAAGANGRVFIEAGSPREIQIISKLIHSNASSEIDAKAIEKLINDIFPSNKKSQSK